MASTSTSTSNSIKIMYNDCYGEFNFSEAFVKEYERRSGNSIAKDGRLFRVGPNSIRCDPIALALLAEKGSEWSSAPNSVIEVHEIPAIFERYWEIEDYAGNETVRTCISEAYADILHTFMETGDREALDRQYAALKKAHPR